MSNGSILVVLTLLLLAALSAACGKRSVVSDAPAQQASSAAAASPAPAQAISSAPAATASPNAAAKASPTPLPIIKEAQAKPGVPVAVPDSVRRPLTGEELQKALQQLPPEVRARIQGLGAAPAPSAKPQPTKKP